MSSARHSERAPSPRCASRTAAALARARDTRVAHAFCPFAALSRPPPQVKFATDTETQTHCAIKVFSREQMASRDLQTQIKKEIAIMKHVRHPNVVNLREVLASKTHVYIVLELVTGGELFDRIVTSGACVALV
jgi:hypothetical protein